jgi:subfamily B ATP-binding cassette protein MsbA
MIDFLRKLLALARPYRLRLATGILCGVFSGVLEPALLLTVVFVWKVIFRQGAVPTKVPLKVPQWLQPSLDQFQSWILNVGGNSPKLTFAIVVAAIPAVMLLRGVIGYLHAYLMNWVSFRAVNDLRVKLFEHLLNLPMSFFSKNSTGELMSRVSDVYVLQNLLGNAMVVVIKEPVTVIGITAMLIALQPTLTMLALLIFPVCLIPVVIYSRKIRRSSAQIQTEYAAMARVMHESFTGNRIIKAYNLESVVTNRFRETTRSVLSHYMRVVRSGEIPGPLIEFFGALGVAALLYFSVALRNQTDSGDFLLFVLSVFTIYRPLKSVIRLQNQVVQARAATERVFQLLDTRSEMEEAKDPQPLQAAGAKIHFQNIDFDYGDKPILRSIEFTVEPGQLVALVGSSGSGKTTLTNLLLRFYDPKSGSITIGGVDIRNVRTQDLRTQIAVVTQETILFNDTIRNNIALGRAGATRKEIEAAAQHAYAHEFIMEKPDGYETLIGEKGIALSGGQRQRLAIARAILKDAPILVLDEATSSLDTESERAVQAALEELMQGRTTICIAHRLSTIQNADVIMVMDQGRIVEVGKHQELLGRGGFYRKLYELQFRSEESEQTSRV